MPKRRVISTALCVISNTSSTCLVSIRTGIANSLLNRMRSGQGQATNFIPFSCALSIPLRSIPAFEYLRAIVPKTRLNLDLRVLNAPPPFDAFLGAMEHKRASIKAPPY